jgi:Transglutaminase-like superfamily
MSVMTQNSVDLNDREMQVPLKAHGSRLVFMPGILRKLIQFEMHLKRGDFASLYAKVRLYPVSRHLAPLGTVETICAAFDLACIWYWKPILCLQRSATITCVLRDHGVSAQMIIGAHNFPFKAHAWVEVAEQVVGDKPYMREIYSVLDVC